MYILPTLHKNKLTEFPKERNLLVFKGSPIGDHELLYNFLILFLKNWGGRLTLSVASQNPALL